MKDGRSEPGKPKKRPERAAGAPSRRANGAGGAERSVRPNRAGQSRDGRPGDRQERERPPEEPGFGPFRGRQRPAVGPDRPHTGEGRGRSGDDRGRRGRDDVARTVRSAAEEAVARATGERPALRIVRGTADAEGEQRRKRDQAGKGKGGAKRAAPAGGAPTVRRPKPGRDGNRLQEALVKGARSLDRGYEQEALRMLRPYREPHPDSADLREMLGVTYYRLGRWSLAQKEIEAFVRLTDSTAQHPVLMDCARALGNHKKVETLWEELRVTSPGAEIVTEGRIVVAGNLADQGKLGEAIKVLERAPANPKRVLPHHLRLWYALADLHERAGDIPAARSLFRRVSAQDPTFVDVAERLSALS